MSRFLAGFVLGLVCWWLPPPVHAQHDGALDGGFHVGAGASDDVFTAAILPGGGLLLGGYFTTFDGQERWRLARLRADGALDTKFDPGDSSGSAPIVQVVALPGGGTYVAGAFTRFGGSARPLVARLNADGTVDEGFNDDATFAGVAGRVTSVVVLPDGKVMVGGRFDASAGSRREVSTFVVRLLKNGQLDAAFTCESKPVGREDQSNTLNVLSEGKLLLGTHEGLIPLLHDGSAEKNTRLSINSAGNVLAAVVQPDGKLIVAVAPAIGGWWIGRLEADGKGDETFRRMESTSQTAGTVFVLALQADGKVLVGGTFRELAGSRRHGLARLNRDGTLDPTFEPGTGVETLPLDEAEETPEAAVHVILPLPEGRLLVAGRFDLYNGAVCHNVARLFNGAVVPTPGIAAQK